MDIIGSEVSEFSAHELETALIDFVYILSSVASGD